MPRTVIASSSSRTTLFVTHAAPEDNEFALWLTSKLAIAGYSVWVDRRRLTGGTDTWDDIDRVLRNEAIKQLVVFTTNIAKLGVKKELAIGTIQRPKQHKIELALRRIVEQGGKLLPLVSALPAAFVVDADQ
jgi:TIR domain